VWDEFEKIERPGLQAELAIDNLKHESLAAFPAMRDCDWAGSLVEALTLDPARSRATMVQNLLKVAVCCGTVELIDAQITQINATGLFNRKLAAAGDIRLEPNFQLFDTATYDGQLLWDATGRMITAYLSRSRSSEQAKERAERTYAELQCDSHEDVSIFLCTEADYCDNLVRSKAFYSDYTRVGLVLKKLPGHLQAAYTAFKTRRKESGEWSDARGTDFDLFANDIEIIAMSLPSDCWDEQGTRQSLLLTIATTLTLNARVRLANLAGLHQVTTAGTTSLSESADSVLIAGTLMKGSHHSGSKWTNEGEPSFSAVRASESAKHSSP